MSKPHKLKPDSSQKSVSDYLEQIDPSSDSEYSTPIAQLLKRKKLTISSSPIDIQSPPLKKTHQGLEMETTVSKSIATNTEVSHEDSKLNEMEEQLNCNLTKNISKNLQGYINDSIIGTLDSMTAAIEKLAETNQNMINQNSEITLLKNENEKLASKVVHLENEQQKINRKLKSIEQSVISCSIIMRGVRESLYEKEYVTKDKVYTELSYLCEAETAQAQLEMARRIGIKQCRRIGKFTEGRDRPICVEFQLREDMDYILSNKAWLRRGVYIDKEYSEEVEKNRKKLRPILKAARNLSTYQGMCRMDGDTIVIQGKKYNMKNLHQLPEEINGFSATSRTNNTTLGFFGELNPLSNFHPALFTYNNIKYHSSEQLIQHTKAEYFGDRGSATKILAAETPLECKKLSRNILNFSKTAWEEVAKDKCQDGIHEKFH